VAGRWFSLDTFVSSTNKTDCHNITEILLKVALSAMIITLTPTEGQCVYFIIKYSQVVKTLKIETDYGKNQLFSLNFA
jgi:hypothetical protein